MARKHMKIKAMALIAVMILNCMACGKAADPAAATTDTSSQSVISFEADTTDTTEEISTEESTEAISTEDKEESSTEVVTEESQGSTEEATEESGTEDVPETTDPDKETLPDPSAKSDESTEPETTDAVERPIKPEVTATKLTVSYIGGTKYVGDRIAASEVTVKVTMSDGSVLTNPSGWSMDTGYQLKEGNNTLTVSYAELTATITVNATVKAAAKEAVAIKAEYVGTKYAGAYIEKSDIRCTVTFSDGSVVVNPDGWKLLVNAWPNKMDPGYYELGMPFANAMGGTSYVEGRIYEDGINCKAVYGNVEILFTVNPGVDPHRTITNISAGTRGPFESGTYNPNDLDLYVFVEYSDGLSDIFYDSWTCDQTSVFFDYQVPTVVTIRYKGHVINAELTATSGLCRWQAEQAFAIQNQYRAEAGLPALEWKEDLYQIACQRAKEITVDFSHNGSQTAGENLCMGFWDVDSLMTAWRRSEGHYENMLRDWFAEGAIAIYYGYGSGFAASVFTIDRTLTHSP